MKKSVVTFVNKLEGLRETFFYYKVVRIDNENIYRKKNVVFVDNSRVFSFNILLCLDTIWLSYGNKDNNNSNHGWNDRTGTLNLRHNNNNDSISLL